MKTQNFFKSSVKLISNDFYRDKRGFFFESYKKKHFKKINFVQDNISFSKNKATLRGLHFQKPPFDQAKLLYVLNGEIFDVVVDLRKNSKTYGEHKCFILNEKNFNSIFISSGFAHGFLTMTKNVKLFYKVSNYYSKKNDYSIKWDDKELSIKWPIKKFNNITLSEKDKNATSFKNFKSPFL